MVRVIDLDETRVGQIIRIDDAAIVLGMFAAQQGVDLTEEGSHFACVSGTLWRRLPYGIQIPARTCLFAHPLPEGIQMMPTQSRGEAAAKRAQKLVVSWIFNRRHKNTSGKSTGQGKKALACASQPLPVLHPDARDEYNLRIFRPGSKTAMTQSNALFESSLPHLQLLNRGKVRDIYAVDSGLLLIVTSDRLSAFDVVLPQPIPGKGEVLTRLSQFWFERMAAVIPNHVAATPLEQVVPDADQRRALGDRALVARRLQPLPVEAIVRGYLIGSGWKDYQQSGGVCGIRLPRGLVLADQLPEPIYTPSTKAAIGAHDENIDFSKTVELLGEKTAKQVRDASLRLYSEAASFAKHKGIIIADTKFEFGLDDEGQLYLIDEALTPDSSRFWPADQYRPGISPPSFDKQFVRDYLETLAWDKKAPAPELPDEIIRRTAEKYREAEARLTGR